MFLQFNYHCNEPNFLFYAYEFVRPMASCPPDGLSYSNSVFLGPILNGLDYLEVGTIVRFFFSRIEASTDNRPSRANLGYFYAVENSTA